MKPDEEEDGVSDQRVGHQEEKISQPLGGHSNQGDQLALQGQEPAAPYLCLGFPGYLLQTTLPVTHSASLRPASF